MKVSNSFETSGATYSGESLVAPPRVDVAVAGLGHLLAGANVLGDAGGTAGAALLVVQHHHVAEHNAAASPGCGTSVARSEKTAATSTVALLRKKSHSISTIYELNDCRKKRHSTADNFTVRQTCSFSGFYVKLDSHLWLPGAVEGWHSEEAGTGAAVLVPGAGEWVDVGHFGACSRGVH
jgi:hypothetical protein